MLGGLLEVALLGDERLQCRNPSIRIRECRYDQLLFIEIGGRRYAVLGNLGGSKLRNPSTFNRKFNTLIDSVCCELGVERAAWFKHE